MSRSADGAGIAIPLRVSAPDGSTPISRSGEPVTLGVPFPRGKVRSGDDLRLFGPEGKPTPAQVRTLARWPDQSVQWALLDFAADLDGNSAQYSLSLDSSVASVQPAHPIALSESSDAIAVDTGGAIFVVRKGASFPISEAIVDGRSVVDPRLTGLRIERDRGDVLPVRVGEIVVEERGILRTTLRITAQFPSVGQRPPLQVAARVHFHAGMATIRLELTLANPHRAKHPGGYWDLGDAGSILLRQVDLVLMLQSDSAAPEGRCSLAPGQPLTCCPLPFDIYQDSSGGENWRSVNHVNRDGIVPTAFRGYRLTSGSIVVDGHRATPTALLTRGDRTIGVSSRYFWEDFPKGIAVTSDAIVLQLWPRQFQGLHEIQGGEQKTHVCHVAFGRDRIDAMPLDWCRLPLAVGAAAEWYCASGVAPYLLPATEGEPCRRRLIESAIDGEQSFAHKREIIDEYGWRHFGDIYGDHEAALHSGPEPLVSHYNNQYDAIAGFGWQFLQTGEHRWLTAMRELASHVCDIDIYHTTEDKAAYNGGMFWHTAHYASADMATHRTYSRRSNAGSGGPSCEHNYATGLLLHHYLTGDARSLEAVIGLARWVLDMDDGHKTVFRWLDAGRTGLASASGSFDYHGPGRGAGNSIRTLVDAHRATGDRMYLEKADELIRRCIHPRDPIIERRLLDAERRWFYTVFLQALGRYLDYKIELGELDHMYAYARESLLAYARWMMLNETPYLERREILEYPDETWVAQDIRKSDVLLFAAKHADGVEREALIERASFFYAYSTATLSANAHHGRTRPTVLMLTNGFLHDYFVRHPGEAAPPPSDPVKDFGQPLSFVPQKTRARARALIVAGVGAGLSLFLLGERLS